MKKDGLQRVLEFLDFLRDRNVGFRIDQQSPDELIVSFALVGARGEATFDVDGMDYCLFTGSESVNTDEAELLRFITSRSS